MRGTEAEGRVGGRDGIWRDGDLGDRDGIWRDGDLGG